MKNYVILLLIQKEEIIKILNLVIMMTYAQTEKIHFPMQGCFSSNRKRDFSI